MRRNRMVGPSKALIAPAKKKRRESDVKQSSKLNEPRSKIFTASPLNSTREAKAKMGLYLNDE